MLSDAQSCGDDDDYVVVRPKFTVCNGICVECVNVCVCVWSDGIRNCGYNMWVAGLKILNR